MLKAYFEGKALREISVQLVERFKTDRMNTPTKKGTARQPATVNRELNLLSSAFSLAVLYDKAEFNPCSKVDLFPLDGQGALVLVHPVAVEHAHLDDGARHARRLHRLGARPLPLSGV